MKQFGAETFENKIEETLTPEAEAERLNKIIAVLKGVEHITVILDSVTTEDIMEFGSGVALVKDEKGDDVMGVSYNPKTGLQLLFMNKWLDSDNLKNLKPKLIMQQLERLGLDKPQKQSQESANYMA